VLNKFTRRTFSFTIGTLISRIFGLVRESIFAYLFGAGFATDAFQVAFRIPNLLRDLFAESALSAAFVPTFVDNLARKDRKEVWRFASCVFNTLFIVVGLLTVLGIIFAPQVVKVIAYGFKEAPTTKFLTITLSRIMFPFLLFVSWASWAMGILNALGEFFLPALAPAFFNLLSIIVPIISYRYFEVRGVHPILGMAHGVSIGALFQFLIQMPRLYKQGFRYSFYLNFKDPDLKKVLGLWIPTILGFASYQINFAVNTFLVTFLEEKSITYLNYAYRIMHLPAGLFGVAVGSVAIAEFSKRTAQNMIDELKGSLTHAFRLISVLTIPVSVLLGVLAIPISRLIYERGKFTPSDTLATAQALMLYAPGIFAQAGVRSLAAGFYSLKDTKTPALIGLIVVVVNFIINRHLMGIIGFRTFPLTTSLTAFLNLGLLYFLLRRKIGGLEGKLILKFVVRSFIYAGGSVMICYLCYKFLIGILGSEFFNELITLSLSVLLGALVFFLLALKGGLFKNL
jgi:putative peptidoglycan lipid II flippase